MTTMKDGDPGSRMGGLGFPRRGTWLAMLAILVTVGLTGCMLQLGNLFSASWLYTQTAKQGTMTATGADSGYIIQLTEASPTTVGFTDRPAHSAASISTASFISQWSSLFAGGSPNASMVFDDSEVIYVFTLSGPVFHPVDHTLWYHAKLIPDGSAATPPETFQSASVFIDNAGPTDPLLQDGIMNSVDVQVRVPEEIMPGGELPVRYSALSQSRPATDGSRVWLFAFGGESGGGSIDPYAAEPSQEWAVVSDSPMGTWMCHWLQAGIMSYCAAYSTSADRNTICAYVIFTPFGVRSKSTTTLRLEVAGENRVSVVYISPPGNTPQSNGNWIGLWRGQFDPNVAPLATTAVSSDDRTGSLTIENVPIERDTLYTIAYCMGQDASTAAATVTFDR